MTTVSVVIPTRNRRGLLATALRSVLWQREIDLEVIVVDEASTDGTAEMVAGLGDPRLALVRHDAPRGLSAARNRGAERANAGWIGFLDDDDVWGPEKLLRQTASAVKAGRAWAYVGAVNVGGALEIVSGGPPPTPDEVIAALPRSNPIPGGGSNVIVGRELFSELGGFDERFQICADWELWARLAAAGPPAFVSHPLMGYRLHGANMSLDTDRIRREARLIEEKHGQAVEWGLVHRWLAESALRMDRRGRALAHYAKASVLGQARGVAADVRDVARRRLARRRGRAADPSRGDDALWQAEATGWLEALGGPASQNGGP